MACVLHASERGGRVRARERQGHGLPRLQGSLWAIVLQRSRCGRLPTSLRLSCGAGRRATADRWRVDHGVAFLSGRQLRLDGRAHFCGRLHRSSSSAAEVKPEPICVTSATRRMMCMRLATHERRQRTECYARSCARRFSAGTAAALLAHHLLPPDARAEGSLSARRSWYPLPRSTEPWLPCVA
jgi:hypothetical protein